MLTRSVEDRKRFDLEPWGWLRGKGWLTEKSDAGTPTGTVWHFEPRGWTGGRAEALDAVSGQAVGDYRWTGSFRRRGTVTWGARSYELASEGWFGKRYELRAEDRTFVGLEVKGWGRRPVTIEVDESLDAEPGLVLFSCWLVQLFVAQDAAAAT